MIGNLGSLILFGRLSDQMGRRFACPAGVGGLRLDRARLSVRDGVVELLPGASWPVSASALPPRAGTAWLAELIGGRDKMRATAIATGTQFPRPRAAPLAAACWPNMRRGR